MILEPILLSIAGGILFYAAQHDIKKREITTLTIILVAITGYWFWVSSNSTLDGLIYAEVILTMLFLIPAIFGMGIGDMLLFWSMGFFFTTSTLLNIFLIGFFIAAAVSTTIVVYINGLWKNKNKLQSTHFPLIPAIFTGFLIYTIYYFIYII